MLDIFHTKITGKSCYLFIEKIDNYLTTITPTIEVIKDEIKQLENKLAYLSDYNDL